MVFSFLLSAGTSIRIDKTTYHAKATAERIKFLILHYTACKFQPSVETLTGPKVSVHYLVSDIHPYHVYELVDESKQAFHAGVSAWQRYTELNQYSIGIEIVNLGWKNDTWMPFPDNQIDAVIQLCQQIVKQYDIKPYHVLGHSDIAPLRKIDPGPLFPWERLYHYGVGAWYDRATVTDHESQMDIQDITVIQKKFKQYGYKIDETGALDKQTTAVVKAFQMHFRPCNYSGVPDTETVAILQTLLDKYGFNEIPAS